MMRYAGFWPRFAAALVDLAVLAPFIYLAYWSLMASWATALLIQVPLTLLFALYNIYFVGRWGQTIGKMTLRVKVVALDGGAAGFRRAFYRHVVDLGFSILSTVLTIYVLTSIPSAEFDALSVGDKLRVFGDKMPWGSSIVDWLSFVWAASELLVLLLNEKRRALHDFIAGTVVVHTGQVLAEV